jgi:hypothetical protein
MNWATPRWYLVVVLLCFAWAVNAFLERESMLTLFSAPTLLFLWVGAVFALDQWVKKGTRQRD